MIFRGSGRREENERGVEEIGMKWRREEIGLEMNELNERKIKEVDRQRQQSPIIQRMY